ncbi:hypothetical protein ACWA7J_21715 [Leptothrix sp. BB-4]
MIRVTFDINPETLGSVTDSHLAGLWHVSQANPAPHGDRQAGELAMLISVEIVRRWLSTTGPELFAHQAADHYWQTLVRHGAWTGPCGTWVPSGGAAPDPTTHAAAAASATPVEAPQLRTASTGG